MSRTGEPYATPYWAHSHDESSLLSELALLVCQKRLRIEDYFLDFDKNRSGQVQARYFKQGLRRCFHGFPFTDQLLGMMAHRFAAPGGMVEWRDFVAAVKEKMPGALELRELGHGDMGTLGYEGASSDDAMEKILDSIHQEVENRRIELKPAFTDFDGKSGCGHVTRDQFCRVWAIPLAC